MSIDAPGISDQVANYNLLEGCTQRSKFLEIDIKLHCNIIIVNMGFGPFSPGDLVRWVGLLIAISSVFRPAISSLSSRMLDLPAPRWYRNQPNCVRQAPMEVFL